MSDLYGANTPDRFWRLLSPQPTEEQWSAAARQAAHVLPPEARDHDIGSLLGHVLGERQFGPNHWRLGWATRAYYRLKPVLPRAATRRMRRVYGARRGEAQRLGWPVEPRYVDFQHATVHHALHATGQASAQFIDFWPGGARYAFVLTHDIETAEGQMHARRVADLDASFGFRSSFNFVPERYRLDRELMEDLRNGGFEVGVHGLKHDGRDFISHSVFARRARAMNRHIAEFDAVGFRAPLTHRNPRWMQDLEIEYDSSFFDTDPFEPIAGGTMSIWPFQLGRFVELPYTLAQDYTVTAVLNETTPRLWLRKVGFIAANRGMALLNTHPDYLRNPVTWNVYEGFLREMSLRADYHHALPRDVARWWRARAGAALAGDLEGGIASTIHVRDGRVEFSDRRAASPPDRHASRTAGARSSAGRTA